MKRILLTSLLVLTGTARLAFADDSPTADEAWGRIIQLLQVTNMQRPTTPEDKDLLGSRLAELTRAADEFWQRYPESSHVWEAKLLALQVTLDRAALDGKQPNLRLIESHVKEITTAGSAPQNIQTEAATILFRLHAVEAAESRDPSKLAALDAEAATFAERYPQSRRAVEVAWLRLEAYERVDSKKAEALLKQYTQHSDPRIAGEAKRRLMMLELTKKPMELKFTGVDGREFDLAKWRGKVVLLDFWATWCGPCRMEMPKVVATYKKLHPKGFEIVGISLDSSKDKLVQYTKQQDMTWPQYFDGRTWENKISRDFGIQAIPEMWLVDKRGYVRSTEARGNLEEQITKLLAE